MFTDVFLLVSSSSNLDGFDYRNKTRVADETLICVSTTLYVPWLLHLDSLERKNESSSHVINCAHGFGLY